MLPWHPEYSNLNKTHIIKCLMSKRRVVASSDIWFKIDFSKIIAFVSPATIQNYQSMGAHDPGF